MNRELRKNEITTPYNNVEEVNPGDTVFCVPMNRVTEIHQRGYPDDKSIMININGHALWLKNDDFLEDFKKVSLA